MQTRFGRDKGEAVNHSIEGGEDSTHMGHTTDLTTDKSIVVGELKVKEAAATGAKAPIAAAGNHTCKKKCEETKHKTRRNKGDRFLHPLFTNLSHQVASNKPSEPVTLKIAERNKRKNITEDKKEDISREGSQPFLPMVVR
ncbi:hypothetical protein GQ457_15G003690 [Hibiscus cannabinus]